jgi:predicted ferric reductase
MTGFAMLCLQPILSSRFRWIERPFGLDRLLRIHRVTGITAAVLVTLHPLVLSLWAGSTWLLMSLNLPMSLTVAKATLLILYLFGLAALFHGKFRIPFQWWLRAHSALAPLIIAGIFLHSYLAVVRYQPLPMRILWFLLAGTGLFGWLHLNLAGRLGGRIHPWKVTDVGSVTHNVWRLELSPPSGRGAFRYLPGQFLFVTLLRKRGLPREEHPFTISSSPSEMGTIQITVKESGDFTGTVSDTSGGDRAVVMAPYGRFSYLLHPPQDDMVFIAGGIGITPFMSMLRYMRESDPGRKVLLIYANRTEGDIAYRNELESMASSHEGPDLELIHVLSNPDPSWEGESGYINGERLSAILRETDKLAFWVCGPPPMMRSVMDALTGMGVGLDRIHMEKFSL